VHLDLLRRQLRLRWRYQRRPPDAVPPSKAEDGGGDIALVFAPDGPVAHLLSSNYRPRRGQALMARLVKRALDE